MHRGKLVVARLGTSRVASRADELAATIIASQRAVNP
jgi:hypothetical protein